MSRNIRILFDTLRSLAFGSVGAGYTAIGTALSNPSRIISIKNLTDTTVIFSLDGVNDHEVLPQGGALVYDLTANKVDDSGSFISSGTTLYAKHSGVAPTVGTVYVSAVYAKGD